MARSFLSPIAALALLLAFAPAARAEEGWGKDLALALAQAKKEGKPVVVDLSQPG